MKKLIVGFVVMTLAMVMASPVLAYRCKWVSNQKGACSFAPGDAIGGINLTVEQSEKINVLNEAYLKEIKPIQDHIYSKRGDLRILWLAKEPDKEKILNLQKEVQNLRGQIIEKATSHRLDVRKVLTPEQLAKVHPLNRMHCQVAQGRIDSKGMGCGAGMGRMCSGSVAPGGQHPCWAANRQMCDGGCAHRMRHRAGTEGNQTPCWKMR